ncbi:type I restriction endonuclease subunit R, EcoR124 family [Anaerococcus vaginalis]|uniref:type I restriction endonuclease subunit R, EcoR124 family n=1 Tax=Anaerococcus vaginalis TaxID=33037 RepID=UPI00290E57AF|nr:HsdR family type I site-specific deoxyribonuclease [Anaerococcus vaginalis]MDU5373251.1 HsdR family type I site-specific deoxyribonuclease [Anaerococcus vaginalis]
MVEIKFDDELKLEKDLINQLITDKGQWTYEPSIKTHEGLWNNFRRILETNNKSVLADNPLTDSEFRQIQNAMTFSSFYEAGKFLVGENGIAKVSVQREDASLGTVRLVVFKREDVAGGSSVYQVINQFVAPKTMGLDRDARFDVTLLINGIPLIQIELKKRSVSHMDAYNQIKNYIATDKYRGLFSCLQCFVISNGSNTRYIAANTDTKLNKKFLTRWNDRDNNSVDDLFGFARDVLSIPQAHQLISHYSVLDNEGENIILLRPYQIHAIKALKEAASKHESGYVWHTTGSGKTLTSYKASRNLYQIPRIEKTIFIVDRVDLDQQTTSSFLAYAANDTVDIESTDNVKNLKSHLLSDDRSVVVTTVQKLNYLINNKEKWLTESQVDKLRKLEIAFVIDECHRAISPSQQNILKKFFINSLWYGFTGTPIFAENKKAVVGNLPQTTEEQFGKRLHEYTVKEAIGDGAVLGFQVENMDMIGEGVYDIVANVKPDMDVYKYEREDLEVYIPDKVYENDKYKLAVIDKIINGMARRFALDRGRGKTYGAILTTSSIKDAKDYYRLFRQVIEGRNEVKVFDRIKSMVADFPKIAMTYSIVENDERTIENNEAMKEALDYYNDEYGTSFSLETIGSYNRNLNERLARKKDKYKSRAEQVDIVIVVDRLLTGFDSPSMSLLLIDRAPMTPQGLIQAFSRTNRLYDERKAYGKIITFRTPKAYEEAIENAFKLYSNGGENYVTAPSYQESKEKFDQTVKELLTYELVESPEIEYGIEKMVKFVSVFQKFDKANAAVMVYSEYEEDEQYYKNAIDKKTLEKYFDQYNYIKALLPTTDETDINLPLDLYYEPISIHQGTIDYNYLANLMQEKAKNRSSNDAKQDSEIEKTIEELAKTNSEKAEIYREIYQEMKKDPDKFVDQNIEELARIKINQIIEEKINKFADHYKVKVDDLVFYTINYKDKKENNKPLGEDELIKNADKDAYNKENGENISLLRYRKLIRTAACDFVEGEVLGYLD